jgi:hypothetical protein
MEIDSRLKTALDESRLLILGAQVLFGFQFEAVFQELFPQIPASSRIVHCVGLVMLLISIGLLIAPSLFHQIIFDGESRLDAVTTATFLAGASLLPLTIGMGAAAYVTFEHLFGRSVGIAAGATFTTISLGLLYGLGFALRRTTGNPMQQTSKPSSLKSKIEQLLTEARVVIPGGQALLGFQLVATLTKAFSELPPIFKYLHAAGLCAVALSVVLLMTPAAVHRIGFQGEDDPAFFKIGSRLVIAASVPLAIGIAADVAVVFFKVTESTAAASAAGTIAVIILFGFWLAYPAWRRSQSPSTLRPT